MTAETDGRIGCVFVQTGAAEYNGGLPGMEREEGCSCVYGNPCSDLNRCVPRPRIILSQATTNST